mgnify:CR=1 FL=1
MGKVNQNEAQEWLESLQQVGEGWWRQANLALSMGAHNALGMEPREFVLAIGRQQTLDAKDAVVEMFQSGTSQKRITEIVGMSARRVQMILAEAGLIEVTPQIQRMLETGKTQPDRTDLKGHPGNGSIGETTARAGVIDAEVVEDDLQAEIEALRIAVAATEAKRKSEVTELKAKVAKFQKELRTAAITAREEAEAALTEQERARAEKEAEAWAKEQQQKTLGGLAFLLVNQVVGALEEAGDGIWTARRKDQPSKKRPGPQGITPRAGPPSHTMRRTRPLWHNNIRKDNTTMITTTHDDVLAAIRAEMARRGIPQAAIAKHLGISQQSFSRRLCGVTPLYEDEIIAIADVIGCRPNDLLRPGSRR